MSAAQGRGVAASVRYSGGTSQCPVEFVGACYKIDFDASRRARRVTYFRIFWTGACPDGDTGAQRLSIAPFKMDSPGAFDIDWEASKAEPSGMRWEASGTLAGRLRRDGTAKGTFFATLTITNPDSTITGPCNSGRVTWKAKLR
jgi:hypothetical protein